MKEKKYLLVITVLFIFLSSLATISVPAPLPPPWVKVFVDQPLGYIPFVFAGAHFQFDIMIVTSGFNDASTPSIVGWTLDFQVDPGVISINTTVGGGFPPTPPDATVIGSKPSYVMYDYAQWYPPPGYEPTLNWAPPPPEGGYWEDIAEVYLPLPATGWGDYMTNTHYSGPAKLVTIEVTSKSDTRGCLIDLQDVAWLDGSNTWHPVDIIIDGYYGTPPAGPGYMSETSGTYNPTQNPLGTIWHELYPNYCHMWEIVAWTDNGDGLLSVSDQIGMLNETGWWYQYHVDAVTTTIHWTFKPDGTNPTGDLRDAEPDDPLYIDDIMLDPVGSYWHQLYPDYSRRFKITSWEDNGDGVFSPSDQFQILYEEGSDPPPFPPPGPGPYWAHLDEITTDIIISQKGDPLGPVPEFPIGLALEILLIPVIIYIWWGTKQRRTHTATLKKREENS